MLDEIQKLISSRPPSPSPVRKSEAEGGCGVIGVACTNKVAGRHLLPALCQMENRGNGKGGGIAAVGLSPETFGISQELLDSAYILAIAYLDSGCREEVERNFIHPAFDIDHRYPMPHENHNELPVAPPEVMLYFVHVKPEASRAFRDTHQLPSLSLQACEDEIVYQNSYRLNRAYYDAAGEKRAFVLSHGKNMLVLKMVGYGNDVIRHYQLEDFQAHVWIGHHRYPTKGRVWHPGGAHPFVGLNEALVHNGDFANYYSICEYLAQRHIHPLFLTDTEVAALLFDLLHRTYRYPLEYVIEAFAPTTERDFTLLPDDKQKIYQLLQRTHMHGSPDGPWFFLIAQSDPLKRAYRLIGITDTSMLRPQVFALQQGPIPIGLAASEKQAIDATLQSLAHEDSRFWSCADYYWNARGGSHTDGGAFSFTVSSDGLSCEDKFGRFIHTEPLNPPAKVVAMQQIPVDLSPKLSPWELYRSVSAQMPSWDYPQLTGFLAALHNSIDTEEHRKSAIEVLTRLFDHPYSMNSMRQSSVKALLQESLSQLLENAHLSDYCAIDARGLPSEGPDSLARMIVDMEKQGFKKFLIFNCQGQRFIGNGLGPYTQGVLIHVYGSSGDYLASGIDGAEIHVHGNAQDQVAQIMNAGALIIHGDVGQTLLYGAKGGKAFVRGNTAGRPLINAVGSPRVVINGTSLDYLAESFMAGNPLKGGGFVIVNGIRFDQKGQIHDLETPYPGSNLFSLASGGAVYLRDPRHLVVKGQLNGGEFDEMTPLDWELILPYLEENARHFDIPVRRLLEHNGKALEFHQIYRKISPIVARSLQDEEAWVKGKN